MFNKKRHNFLHAKSLHRRPMSAAARKLVTVFGVLAGIAAVAALVIVPLLLLGDGVYRHAQAGKADLEQAQQLAGELRFAEARAFTESAEAEFSAAQSNLGPFLMFRRMPWAGPYITAADRLLESGSAATHALTDLMGAAANITGTLERSEALAAAMSGSLPDAAKLYKELTPEQKRDVLKGFSEAAPQMRDALGSIDASLAALDAVPQDQISQQLVASIEPMRPRLQQLRLALTLALPVAERAPAVLGYPEARRYLFFFQNNTELRPTGGFLGVFGLLVVKDADILEMTTEDIYSLDGPAEAGPRPAPPAPIQKYIGIDKWYLRDANWSPDFVASASLMAQFYAQEYQVARKGPAPNIDGVIAIDTEVAKDVLRLTGPMTVQGKTFTPDNVVDSLEFAVEREFVQQGIPVDQRKQIIAELVRSVIARLESMPLQKLMEAVDIAKRNLDEGHVLLAMRDAELENDILDRDWGGKLRPVVTDYVSVIDANLASLKSDPAVQRTIKYSVVPSGNGFDGRVDITYSHKGRFDWKTTRYRTYTRLYVPSGTELLGVDGAMENDRIKDPARRPGRADVLDELQRRSFGAFISIEPGETSTLSFRFKLAPSVVAAIRAGEYRLDVEKQPGTIAHGLTLDLDFGKKLKTAVPAEESNQWGDNVYRVNSDLRLDRVFTTSF